MSRLRAQIFILACILFVPSLSRAQDAAVGPTEEAKAAEKQARELLETIADGIPSLHNSGNRIYLASAVADLFWPTDEKRARALFEMVKQDLVTATAQYEPSDRQSSNEFQILQQRRRECLERMARRDPELALSFLRATRPPAKPANINQQTNETNLELYLADLLVAKDPELAFRLSRQVLRKSLSYQVISVLSQLSSKNKELAQTLYREFLDRLKIEDLSKNRDAAGAAWNLLYAFQPPQANEDAYRELVELLAELIASAPPDPASRNAQNSRNQIQSLMPQLEKYAPARVPIFNRLLQTIKPMVDPNGQLYQTLNEVSQRGTVDDVLALAARYGPEFRSGIYQQAAWKASRDGDGARARQILSEFITDPAQRRQLIEQLDSQLLWNSINQSKVAETRELLSKIKSVEQQAQLLINLAVNVANKGDKSQALALMVEAKTLLDSSPATSGKLNAQLQLAQAYASLDAPQSVTLMQAIVGLVNQLVAAAVVLDGFENRYLQDGEWMKSGSSNLSNLVNSIEQNLGQLALQDAEGARAISDQLERPEIRLMAQLEMAKTLIGQASVGHGFPSRNVTSLPLKDTPTRR